MTEASKITIEWRAHASLKPYHKNAKQHSDAQVQKIANLIKEVGPE